MTKAEYDKRLEELEPEQPPSHAGKQLVIGEPH